MLSLGIIFSIWIFGEGVSSNARFVEQEWIKGNKLSSIFASMITLIGIVSLGILVIKLIGMAS